MIRSPSSLRRITAALGLVLLAASGCKDDSTSAPEPQVKAGSSAAGGGGTGGSSGSAGGSSGGAGAAGEPPLPDDGKGVVRVSGGEVQGDMLEGAPVRLFRKIPYAKPPVGDLRWRPPVKPDDWSGVRHEAELSLACPQNTSAGSKASLNEDCLYLNVWQPVPRPDRAPVMVWIHGGGNFAGGTNDVIPMTNQLWFDGQVFAKRHGVIVVTLNYRLGVLGFFAHADLAAEGSNPGNQGLLDQHFALEWVRDNIAAFGGDPGNVTIFGESAGSADVCYHVASPKSRGLFHRAISQSGGCTSGFGREATPAQAAPMVQQFAAATGCEATGGQLACLRGKPIETIMANAMQPDPMASSGIASGFGVTIDGAFLPKSGREIFDAGELNDVPYILGSNSDEGTLFLLNTVGPMTAAEYTAQLSQRFGDFAPQVEAAYPPSKFGDDPRKALARAIGDSGLVCGTHDSARRAAQAGRTVYMYNFNVPWAVGAGALGATHAAEISHVFGLPFMPDAASQRVADEMNAYWARFARTGDPNGSGAPAVWPRFMPDSNDNDKRLQFDAEFEVLDNFRKEECAFWRSRP